MDPFSVTIELEPQYISLHDLATLVANDLTNDQYQDFLRMVQDNDEEKVPTPPPGPVNVITLQITTLRELLRLAAFEAYYQGAEDCSGWNDVKDIADVQVDHALARAIPAYFDAPKPEPPRGGPDFEWGKRYLLTRPKSNFPPGEVYLTPGTCGGVVLSWAPDPTQTVLGRAGHFLGDIPARILSSWPDAYWEEA